MIFRKKFKRLKKELDNNQEAHKDATDALKTLKPPLAQPTKNCAKFNQKQNKNKNTLNSLKKQSLNFNENLSQQQKQLSTLLYQQYMHGNQSYSQLILQNKNPSEIARDVKYFSLHRQRACQVD